MNPNMAREMISCIVCLIRADLIGALNLSRWFAFVLDENYDKAWKAQLMTVVRFVHKGRVRTAYFRLIELTRRHVYYNGTRTFIKAGCALSIAIRDEMQSLNIDLKKLVCLCTDGASAMIEEGWNGCYSETVV